MSANDPSPRILDGRDSSNRTAETRHQRATSTSEAQPATRHVRRKSSFRSIRSFMRNTSRSISLPRNPLKRDTSVDKIPRPERSLSRKRKFLGRDVFRTDSSRPEDRFMMTTALPAAQLPEVEPQTRLSADLAQFTSKEMNGGVPLSHIERQPRVLRRQTQRLSRDTSGGIPISTLLTPANDPFSEDVADWNIAESSHRTSDRHHGSSWSPTPLFDYLDEAFSKDRTPDTAGSGFVQSTAPPRRLSHKPDLDDLKTSTSHQRAASVNSPSLHANNPLVPDRRRISRSSLHKPLPDLPHERHNHPKACHANIDSAAGRDLGYIIYDSQQPIDIEAHLDLSNSEETRLKVIYSPAVTKETQVVNTHEIVQQAITKEIHNHHYHHRILPVVDIEVLPPRHFIPAEGGGYTEISEADVPGGANIEELQQLVKDAVSNFVPKTEDLPGPRQFTARTFEGTQGDFEESTTPEGIQRTEQWWVHPPSAEEGGKETGQTLPFVFGSSRWADATRDSLRAVSPSDRASPSNAARPTAPNSGMHTVLPIRMVHADE